MFCNSSQDLQARFLWRQAIAHQFDSGKTTLILQVGFAPPRTSTRPNFIVTIQSRDTALQVTHVELRMLLDLPVYEMAILSPSTGDGSFVLCNAMNGEALSPISKGLATDIALADFTDNAKVKSIELIEDDLSSHSEYRGKELPVWRVTLDHHSGTVIYVSAQRGIVTARRNNRWRLFDFFWMLHTMDYQGRDNFGHWILRAFSVFGVVSVLSGYWLWWRTSSVRRRLRQHKQRPKAEKT